MFGVVILIILIIVGLSVMREKYEELDTNNNQTTELPPWAIPVQTPQRGFTLQELDAMEQQQNPIRPSLDSFNMSAPKIDFQPLGTLVGNMVWSGEQGDKTYEEAI
jgi:hypothetical protein